MADVHVRVLTIARDTVGGMENLARALQVDITVLQNWIEGRCNPTTQAFLDALDIVAMGRPLK